MSQSTAERKGIANAIWLCGTCSILIDKNNGHDYPVDHLRKWKRDHEKLITECLEGARFVAFERSHSAGTDQHARFIVRHLEDRAALYRDYRAEDPRWVLESLKELRQTLTSFRAQLVDAPDIDVVAESIVRACRHYMNTTPENPSISELEYSLGAVRKIVGVNLGLLLKRYPVSISPELEQLIPT